MESLKDVKDERTYKPEECQATVLLFWDEGSRKPIREKEGLGLLLLFMMLTVQQRSVSNNSLLSDSYSKLPFSRFINPFLLLLLISLVL